MPSENSIRIAIDQSQIYVLQGKYYSATKILSDVLEPYSTGQYLYTSAVKDAYEFKGDIYLMTGSYELAVHAYKVTDSIADLVGTLDRVTIKTKLGRAYNLKGDLDIAKSHNLATLEKATKLRVDEMGHILADAYFNVAESYYLDCDVDNARKHLEKALNQYESNKFHKVHNSLGIARCCELGAHILKKDGFSQDANSLLQEAIDRMELLLGPNHPEVIAIKKTQ